MQLPMKTLIALLPFFVQANAGASGTGTTTRYWDCCKPSCAWSGKATLASGSNPVTTCDIHDNPLTDYSTASGCDGGAAYQCSSEAPWAVTDDLAYGFAAVNIAGGSEASWCCACYELTFTSGAVAGKKMIVQATNTGGDLAGNQFDISMPGGGVGIFNGCTTEWGAPSSGWGAQYGGISASSDCSSFPAALQAGCNWRFGWFGSSDNPTVSFEQVACPAAITAKSGCTRADDTSMAAPAAPVGGSSSSTQATVVASSSTTAKAVASSVKTSSTSPAEVATSSAPVVEASSSSAPVATSAPVVESPVASTSASAIKASSAPVVEAPSSPSVEASTSAKLTVAPKATPTASASPSSPDDDSCIPDEL